GFINNILPESGYQLRNIPKSKYQSKKNPKYCGQYPDYHLLLSGSRIDFTKWYL
ncbi:hypothetical protein HHI36_002411, partial [Cryptolaemus montrouzieri]